MQPEHTGGRESPDAEAVFRFLSASPDFFDRNGDLLARLRVPHATGAVSLVEKQVAVLRAKCDRLEHGLRDLVGVARDNERLHARLHGLTQQIISAPDVGAVMSLAGDALERDFNASDVRFAILDRGSRKKGARVDVGHPRAAAAMAAGASPDALEAAFADVLESGSATCGLPDAERLALLVGTGAGAAAHVASAALVPLAHEGRLGVAMLASRDESRFVAGKGTLFLDQLGETLARRLKGLGVRAR